MLNNTHELIQEISPYWNEQSDLDHFYRNTLRILNSHSERIDTALALLECFESYLSTSRIVFGSYKLVRSVGNENEYWVFDRNDQEYIFNSIPEALSFIKQQNATNI